MENNFMQRLLAATQGTGLPEPQDGRNSLQRNPEGKNWKNRDVAQLKGLVLHQELGWGTVDAVARYHTGPDSHLHPGGVESISYTWAVRRDGQIVLCNDFNKTTWSQGDREREGDENSEFMAVMFEGLFKGEGVNDPSAGEPTSEQTSSAMLLWHACKDEWNWNNNNLYGHYHFGKVACPGNSLGNLIKSVRFNGETSTFVFSTVEDRQRALKELGYFIGEIDGLWGPISKGALIRFQNDQGLETDGIWGPDTVKSVLQRVV